MNEQTRITKVPLQGNGGGITIMDDRYYVHCLTAQIFLVRERISTDGKPGSDDRLVRAFEVRHDADLYARGMNDKQKQPNEPQDH